MKSYGGVDVQIHVFLTSAIVEGEWSASRPCRFTPGEKASTRYSFGRRVGGPQRRSGRRWDKKNLAFTATRNLAPRPFAILIALYQRENLQLHMPVLHYTKGYNENCIVILWTVQDQVVKACSYESRNPHGHCIVVCVVLCLGLQFFNCVRRFPFEDYLLFSGMQQRVFW
jgi:hypothetical protein